MDCVEVGERDRDGPVCEGERDEPCEGGTDRWAVCGSEEEKLTDGGRDRQMHYVWEREKDWLEEGERQIWQL